MKRLPTEIWNQIFIFLHQEDKIECMHVCHHWEIAINSLSLFHTVRATSLKALDKMIKTIQEKPYKGIQVEQLILQFQYTHIDLTKILPLLPNLHVLSLLENESSLVSTGTDKVFIPHFYKHIEYILECSVSSKSIPLLLLEANVCPSLTTLSVSIKNKNIISLLKNAPALKNLTIGFDIIGLNDLEQIHANAPCLISVKVISMLLDDFDSVDEIKPAVLIDNCIFDGIPITSSETETILLGYISKKYPNLSKLTYNVERTRVSDSDKMGLYKYGWAPLFKALGPCLKEICIGQANRVLNLFDMLDTFHSHITSLTIRSKLSPSILFSLARANQRNFIQTLKLCINSDHTTFMWLKNFTSLKTLKLASMHGEKPVRIQLNHLLDVSPATLKALALRNIELVLDDTDYIRLSSLDSLSFTIVTLPEKIDVFISKHLPRLSRLEFKHCNLHGRTLFLPNNNLGFFKFVEVFPYKNRFIQISTLDEQRLYTTKPLGLDLWKFGPELRPLEERSKFGAPAFPAIKSMPVNEIQTSPFFKLICNSLRDVFILDTE